ncbi:MULTISPECIES: 50S ribosomal protein L23 [Rickettsiella]|jgi:large subunit ribosomal protein L23|nr:50S ribosomal protein L23 [Candidatus Rickettsiella isopodorum]MCH9637005.1 50S ribosomal protein L23 [Gammaproteobacteria bacterium]MCH9755355.1 50S ribosomal protein L23 [Gammaproteobacteria bacterium]MDD5162033.1 50S ribosomal protein L23 [Candidatus Rickettsiella isopodorum]MDQ5899535.1 large subunit ribosomal protein [Pseudomonadota bacterium]
MMNIALTQQLRRFKIIERPHLSEKSTMLADKHRQFVFKVLKNANKSEIKQAVESLFNVKVNAIQLLNVKPKDRRFKQVEGQLKGWKKAYVSLKAGYDIDFTGTK